MSYDPNVPVEISHPDVETNGFVLPESLPVWLEIGWSVVEKVPEPEPVKYVTKNVKGKETIVEMALPDETESEQVVVEDPKEI